MSNGVIYIESANEAHRYPGLDSHNAWALWLKKVVYLRRLPIDVGKLPHVKPNTTVQGPLGVSWHRAQTICIPPSEYKLANLVQWAHSPPPTTPPSFSSAMNYSNSTVVTIWCTSNAISYNGTWCAEEISLLTDTAARVQVARSNGPSVSLKFYGERPHRIKPTSLILTREANRGRSRTMGIPIVPGGRS